MFLYKLSKGTCAFVFAEADACAHDADEFAVRREVVKGFRHVDDVGLMLERWVHHDSIDEEGRRPGHEVGALHGIAFCGEDLSIRFLDFAEEDLGGTHNGGCLIHKASAACGGFEYEMMGGKIELVDQLLGQWYGRFEKSEIVFFVRSFVGSCEQGFFEPNFWTNVKGVPFRLSTPSPTECFQDRIGLLIEWPRELGCEAHDIAVDFDRAEDAEDGFRNEAGFHAISQCELDA